MNIADMEATLLFSVKYNGCAFKFCVQDGLYTPDTLRKIMLEALIDTVADLRIASATCAFSAKDAETMSAIGVVAMPNDGEGVWKLSTAGNKFATASAGRAAVRALAAAGFGPAERLQTLLADDDTIAVYQRLAEKVGAHHDIYPQRVEERALVDVCYTDRDADFMKLVEERVRAAVCEEEPASMEPDWQVYSEHGYATCPSCGSDKIATQDTERYGDTELRVHKTCPNCSFSWDDIYDLTCSKSDNGWESGNYGGE